jgi:hypothetical protein
VDLDDSTSIEGLSQVEQSLQGVQATPGDPHS